MFGLPDNPLSTKYEYPEPVFINSGPKYIPYKSLMVGSLDDVVHNLNWSLSNKTIAKDEVPIIKLKEWQQTKGILDQLVGTFKERVQNKFTGYDAIYSAMPTGNVFLLPYYNEYHHQINNTWSPVDSKALDLVEEVTGNIMKKLVVPSAGIERPSYYSGATKANFSFRFSLINTTSDGYKDNLTFLDALIYNNLQSRMDKTLGGLYPPCIYSYEIPGIRNSPAAVISALQVNNIGQMNNIQGNNIPDAWEIQIGIEDLILESRQIYSGALGGKVVTAIKDESEET